MISLECMSREKLHIPVMVKESIEHLNLAAGMTIVDATAGTGGHSRCVLERITPGGKLIAIDRDAETLEIARDRLKDFGTACKFVHANFMDIDKVLGQMSIKNVDGILFDLGVSSVQLDDPERGFSFQSQGPLDMRMDRSSQVSAYDLLNNLNEEEISSMLWHLGQERFANRIARYLVRERQRHPISTTQELKDAVVRAIPPRFRHYRIHPATRTFQAIRIAVNRELETLEIALGKAINLLGVAKRICVISFHSLEDRIVKLKFRASAASGELTIITPKPLIPDLTQRQENPSCRSAKFRAAQRC